MITACPRPAHSWRASALPTGDYLDSHPTKAFLLVEVADSSLAFDRFTKGPLYAATGVPEYWIVNLVDGVVEVYAEPRAGTYTAVSRYDRSQSLAVPSFDGVVVPIADIFPPKR